MNKTKNVPIVVQTLLQRVTQVLTKQAKKLRVDIELTF